MPADKKLTLTLADGTKLSGKSFGAHLAHSAHSEKTPIKKQYNNIGQGEVVFATGIVGYPESLTDPSFAGQILVLTYPLVGNYGIPAKCKIPNLTSTVIGDAKCEIMENFESNHIQVSGLVVSEYSNKYSHQAAKQSLADWLKDEGVPAITGVDTRALTQNLREHGTILGKLTSGEERGVENFYNPAKDDLVAKVSPRQAQFYLPSPRLCRQGSGKSSKTVAILDCGMKLGILRSFLERGVSVWRLPHDHDLSGIKYDGLFISNGPGDPQQTKTTIQTVHQALKKEKPIFGICLGHQILALASGHQTYKLPYGHRSQNQPVREITTRRCFVTSQNHGYAVSNNLKTNWEVTFENINDGSVEGLRHRRKPFFSVQFHPEARPGPTDSDYLFDEFIRQL